ncbi:MAG: hypothetical protein HC888_06855, partial [Candidatus Competibacteraceae bacterium]|nr:hypothetical protein [Candidatus Competibacteraceae bacterium]
IIVGDPEAFSLSTSTSSVDEGEEGKVKALRDFVFEKSGIEVASGLAIPASRGGSLDIGVLHTSEQESRTRCTIEFWFYLPSMDSFAVTEIILIRRTMGEYSFLSLVTSNVRFHLRVE